MHNKAAGLRIISQNVHQLLKEDSKWDAERDKVRERARKRTINMSQRGRDNARERKWWWWWQELAKKWQNVGTGFSFHFISCQSIPFHAILFRFVPLCSHLCQFAWWRGHVVSSMNMFVVSHSPSLHLSLCNNYKDAMTRGQTMQNILMLESHRDTREKKPELNWHLIRESTKGFRWPKQNKFNLF